MLWMLFTAHGADLTLDTEAQIALRPGALVGVTARVVGGLTFGASVTTTHDPYLGAGLSFDRKRNVRVGLLPSVGLVARPGARDRWDLHVDLQIGPELLATDVAAERARVVIEQRRTVVAAVANLRAGTRHRLNDHLGLGWTLSVPLAPGLAGGSVPVAERVVLGLGLSWMGG